MRLLVFVFVLALPATGCDWYFGDDPPCAYGGGQGDRAPSNGYDLRDPHTGQCTSFGNNYPDETCAYSCGPCPDNTNAADPVPLPSWGMCDSYRSDQDEQTCVVSPGCRAAYGDVEGVRGFVACWAVDQMGPVQGGLCEGLDAWSCSQHDDCSAVHACTNTSGEQPIDPSECAIGQFQSCIDEKTGCFTANECSPDETCNAEDVCLPPPGCGTTSTTDEDSLIDCTTQCYGFCGPDLTPTCAALLEGPCIERNDCSPFYQGVDCTCDEAGNCECTDWVFDTCEDASITPAN